MTLVSSLRVKVALEQVLRSPTFLFLSVYNSTNALYSHSIRLPSMVDNLSNWQRRYTDH